MPTETTSRRLKTRVRAEAFLAALASSLLVLVAAPPIGLWPLAVLSPVPLFWVSTRAGTRPISGAIAATLGMVPFWAWEHQWVFSVSAVGAPLLVVYMSLAAGLFVLANAWIARRLRVSGWLTAPVVWIALEYLRGSVLFGGYPWLLTGHPLIESARVARPGVVVGAYGVSLLCAALGAGLGAVACGGGRGRVAAILSVVGVVAAWAGLASVPAGSTEGNLRIAVVQTNVAQSVRGGWTPPNRLADLDRMLAMTIEAASLDPRPELIVWPETMFPGDSIEPSALNAERAANLIWHTSMDAAWPALRLIVWRGPDGIDDPVAVEGPYERGARLVVPTTVAADSVLTWQGRLGVPLLIGADGIDGLTIDVTIDGAIEADWEGRHNSSILIEDGRVGPSRYDKMHLTPFGEVMPVISRWKWLERFVLRIGVGAAGMAFDLDPGRGPAVHPVRSEEGLVRVGTPICFEGILPDVCRRLAFDGRERRADVLVQMTNEGWFDDYDAGREHHLMAVRWRALELGTPVVRAANTGISAAIGVDGSLLGAGVEAGRTNEAGVLSVDVPLGSSTTVYAAIGDVAGWGGALAALLLGVGGLIRGRPQSREARTAEKPER